MPKQFKKAREFPQSKIKKQEISQADLSTSFEFRRT
jgi:hypothetical protein